jgi:hypothetical protein
MGVLEADRVSAASYALPTWLPGDTHITPTPDTVWLDVLNGRQR